MTPDEQLAEVARGPAAPDDSGQFQDGIVVTFVECYHLHLCVDGAENRGIVE